MYRTIPRIALLLCLVVMLLLTAPVSGQESDSTKSAHMKAAALPETTKEKLRHKMELGDTEIKNSIFLVHQQWELDDMILDRRYKQGEMSLVDYGAEKVKLLDDEKTTTQALYDAEIAYITAFLPYFDDDDNY
jgi:hypothetical protein